MDVATTRCRRSFRGIVIDVEVGLDMQKENNRTVVLHSALHDHPLLTNANPAQRNFICSTVDTARRFKVNESGFHSVLFNQPPTRIVIKIHFTIFTSVDLYRNLLIVGHVYRLCFTMYEYDIDI
ncbi:hypothetical protein KC19_VG117300 [Ceratodon purpureus]|uniref:Uncharacterized protein n=1 Tax=Ceratodon purpureus TaxID=3225 RepID=A0A8T0HPG3_CERPU|nr:hypothetical protein KC19_VG117300 [Ceratodon purpureus]